MFKVNWLELQNRTQTHLHLKSEGLISFLTPRAAVTFQAGAGLSVNRAVAVASRFNSFKSRSCFSSDKVKLFFNCSTPLPSTKSVYSPAGRRKPKPFSLGRHWATLG